MSQELSEGLLERFDRVANELSPEWLTCDGELSRAEVRRKLKRLKAEWRALEAEAGRAVTEDEVFQAAYAKVG